MLTIAKLAHESDLNPHTVRYYSKLGLITPTRHPDNHYRLFGHEAIARLRFIRQAKQLGLTLKDIQQVLQHADQGDSPCAEVRDMLQSRLQENQKRIDELIAMQHKMQHALAQWQNMPDQDPSDHSICHLIESFSAR